MSKGSILFQSNSKLLITFQKSARVNGFELDSAQVNAVSYLEPLLFQLVKVESKNPFSRYLENRRSRLGGLYLWGGVGRGKSFLMDSFYNFVPLLIREAFYFQVSYFKNFFLIFHLKIIFFL